MQKKLRRFVSSSVYRFLCSSVSIKISQTRGSPGDVESSDELIKIYEARVYFISVSFLTDVNESVRIL